MAGETVATEANGEAQDGLIRRAWRRIWNAVIIVAGIAIALGYGGALNAPRSVPAPAMICLGLFLSIIGWWLSALVHEAGHALGARAVGWRNIIFVVLPVAVRVRPLGLAFMSRDRERDARGWVLAIPPSSAVSTHWRETVYIGGGPIASLLLAAAGISIGLWLSAPQSLDPFGGDGRNWGLFAGLLGYQALIEALGTLLPATRGTRTTDGDKIRALWRSNAQYEGWRAAGRIIALDRHEARLRDYPQWLIDRAREAQPPPDGLTAWLDSLEISVALDAERVDIPRARRLLDAYLAVHGDGEWRATCDAWLAVAEEGDVDRARAAAWQGEHDDHLIALNFAVAAALAARAGDRDGTEELLAAMIEDRSRRRDGERHFRDAVFEDIATKIRNLLPATPA